MASIVPQLPQYRDPSYIGYSREQQGDKSLATAVAGLGNIFGNAVNLIDQSVKAQIEQDVKEGVGLVNDGPSLDLPEDSPINETDEDQTTTVDVFSEERMQANGSPNAQGTQTNNQARRLTQAFRAGRITPTYYWGQMAKLSKELKARYPGYGDQIDRQFQGLTGQIPANALANAKRREYTGYLAKVNEEEKHFQSLIKQKWVQGHLPADYWERIEKGDPYTKMETYKFIHEGERTEATLSAEKTRIALAKSRGDLVQEDAVSAATNRVNSISSTILNSTFGQNVVNAITDSIAGQAQGVSITPQEKQLLSMQFGQLKARIKQAQIEALSAPDAEGNTYNSLIGDPSKTKGILDVGQQELNVLEDMLTNEDFGLFAATLNNIKARKEHFTNEVLKFPLYGYIQGIKDVGGSEIFDQMQFNTSFQKQIEDTNKAMLGVLAAQTITGDQTPLGDRIGRVLPGVKGDKLQRAAVTSSAIEQSIMSLTHESTVPQAQEAAAMQMFGEGNRNFLLHFSENPKQQRTVYNQMLAPQVTKTMLKVKERRPQLWDRYVDWAKESFTAMQFTNISTVNEGIVEREDTNISWNPEAKRFEFALTERGKQRRQKAKGTILSYEDSLNTEIEIAVSNLNKQIAVLADIIEADGGNVEEELAVLLGAAGVNPNAKKIPTFFAKMRDRLNDSIQEEKKKGENTK